MHGEVVVRGVLGKKGLQWQLCQVNELARCDVYRALPAPGLHLQADVTDTLRPQIS